eukprot:gnl/TRDRNA2_/TRDRNA2_96396_c2_seq1.p1 gnl/TRDRNA2_/TRDRNA2_96396_c2~~gnl/TRDRNA2_/TRDRNA2_96396_c2_seq1.p1  ORF type:complete len:178 (+),score=11.24 gnl/TRDRNA2_/TRDRNA2_96396_c2_seq1:26-535(+)
MWDGTPHQGPVRQLGGAFHVYHVYQCFNESMWPHVVSSVDVTLAAQDAGSGVWGGHYIWSEREQWGTISTCIDLDGIYTATRGARRVPRGLPYYRWDEVKKACLLYLRTAHFLLTNRTKVLSPDIYGQSTHLLHGPLYAVAECQQHFPQLVKTVRPWRRWTDEASCIYA